MHFLALLLLFASFVWASDKENKRKRNDSKIASIPDNLKKSCSEPEFQRQDQVEIKRDNDSRTYGSIVGASQNSSNYKVMTGGKVESIPTNRLTKLTLSQNARRVEEFNRIKTLEADTTCKVCCEEYDETHVPSALTCGHVLCILCRSSLPSYMVPEAIKCPECRSPQFKDHTKPNNEQPELAAIVNSLIQQEEREAELAIRRVEDFQRFLQVFTQRNILNEPTSTTPAPNLPSLDDLLNGPTSPNFRDFVQIIRNSVRARIENNSGNEQSRPQMDINGENGHLLSGTTSPNPEEFLQIIRNSFRARIENASGNEQSRPQMDINGENGPSRGRMILIITRGEDNSIRSEFHFLQDRNDNVSQDQTSESQNSAETPQNQAGNVEDTLTDQSLQNQNQGTETTNVQPSTSILDFDEAIESQNRDEVDLNLHSDEEPNNADNE